MADSSPHIRLPLERLFIQLEAAGFKMDTSRKLRMLQALDQRGHLHVGDFDSLKFLLAPLVATSDKEQALFYKIFEDLWQQAADEAQKLAAGKNIELLPQDQPASEEETVNWRSYWWVIPILLLLLSAPFLREWLFPTPALAQKLGMARISKEGPIREMDTLSMTAGASANVDSSELIWELFQLDSGRLEVQDSGFRFDWVANGSGREMLLVLRTEEEELPADSSRFIVSCAREPEVFRSEYPESPLVKGRIYEFSAFTDDDVQVEWIFEGGDTMRGQQVSHAFQSTGFSQIRLEVFREGERDYCLNRTIKELTVGNDKPFLAMVDMPPDQQRLINSLHNWVWAFLYLPILLGVIAFAYFVMQKRKDIRPKTEEELAEMFPIYDRPPYYITYQSQEHKINIPSEFFRMSGVLRRRETSERLRFDPIASVKATIDKGGFPAWRERADTNPSDYLFLIARPNERDQQGCFFERLIHFFQGQDVPLSFYFHDGSFRSFWNRSQPEGVSLNYLTKEYGHHRLIVMGNGHGLVNPYDTRQPSLLKEPLQALQQWQRRLILTPSPVSAWSFQEALLHEHFLLLPADREGILMGLELLDDMDEYEPGSYIKWEGDLSSRRTDLSDRYRLWDNVEDHRKFLANDPDCFRWLCGLAVNTKPDFALTIAIGRSLGINVTHDRLLRLTRIPWLSANEPSDHLRLLLLKQLSDADEQKVRQVVLDELEAIREQVQKGFAQTEWTSDTAMQRFALDPRDPAQKEMIRDLRRMGLLSGSQLNELDQVVDKQLSKNRWESKKEGVSKLDVWLDDPMASVDRSSTVSFLQGVAGQIMEKLGLDARWVKGIASALILFALGVLLLGEGDRYNQSLKASKEPVKSIFVKVKVGVDPAIIQHNQAVEIASRLLIEESYENWRNFYLASDPDDRDSKKTIDSIQMVEDLLQQAIYERSEVGYLQAKDNLAAWKFNVQAKELNFYLSDSIQGDSMAKIAFLGNRASTLDALLSENDWAHDSVILSTIHATGLCRFYLYDFGDGKDPHQLVQASSRYQQLMVLSDSTYFDDIHDRMPVNLQTLLAEMSVIIGPKYGLKFLVLDTSGKPIKEAFILPKGQAGELVTDGDGYASIELEREPSDLNVMVQVQANGYTPSLPKLLRFRTSGKVDTIVLERQPDVPRDKEPDPNEEDTDVDTQDNQTNQSQLQQDLPVEDKDSDGVPDIRDNCPNVPGEEKNGGCPLQAEVRIQFANDKTREAINGVVVNYSQREYSLGAAGAGEAKVNGNRATFDVDTRYNVALEFVKEGYQNVETVFSPSKETITVVDGKPVISLAFSLDLIPPPKPSAVPEMIRIPSGTATIGCTSEQQNCQEDEKPVRKIRVTAFHLSKHEVTNAQFAAYLDDGFQDSKSKRQWMDNVGKLNVGIERYYEGKKERIRPVKGRETEPVVQVSWGDARSYCSWLSGKEGRRYRLPTEEEWEYAARGGDQRYPTQYAGDNTLDNVGWYQGNANGKVYNVGLKKPNQLGLYDMSGNVWEWTNSDYIEKTTDKVQKGTGTAKGKVIRGGAYSSKAYGCRTAYRDWIKQGGKNGTIGFRVAY